MERNITIHRRRPLSGKESRSMAQRSPGIGEMDSNYLKSCPMLGPVLMEY